MIITDRYNELLSRLFLTLSNRKRLAIVMLLAEEKTPLTVVEISTMLSFNRHQTSQLCSTLKATGIILSHREGKNTLYRSNDIFPLSLVIKELSFTSPDQ